MIHRSLTNANRIVRKKTQCRLRGKLTCVDTIYGDSAYPFTEYTYEVEQHLFAVTLAVFERKMVQD